MANKSGSTDNWTPGTWIGVGVLLAALVVLLAAASGDAGYFVLSVGGVVASVVLAIGVIAKGVEVALRTRQTEDADSPTPGS